MLAMWFCFPSTEGYHDNFHSTSVPHLENGTAANFIPLVCCEDRLHGDWRQNLYANDNCSKDFNKQPCCMLRKDGGEVELHVNLTNRYMLHSLLAYTRNSWWLQSPCCERQISAENPAERKRQKRKVVHHFWFLSIMQWEAHGPLGRNHKVAPYHLKHKQVITTQAFVIIPLDDGLAELWPPSICFYSL